MNDDDDTDTAHKTRKNRIRNVAHILANLHDAEKYLEDTAEESGERHADEYRAHGMLRRPHTAEQGCGDDRHRAGGTANLRMGATEQGGKKAEERCADKSRKRTHGACRRIINATERLDAECQCERQRHDSGSDAAKYVTLNVVSFDKRHIYLTYNQSIIKYKNRRQKYIIFGYNGVWNFTL